MKEHSLHFPKCEVILFFFSEQCQLLTLKISATQRIIALLTSFQGLAQGPGKGYFFLSGLLPVLAVFCCFLLFWGVSVHGV